jgi:hypothetical protein
MRSSKLVVFLILICLLGVTLSAFFYPPPLYWVLGVLGIYPIFRTLPPKLTISEANWQAASIHHYRLTVERTWVAGPISKETEHPCQQEFEVLDEKVIHTNYDSCVTWPPLGLPQTVTVSTLFSIIEDNIKQLEWRDPCSLYVAYPRYSTQYGYPIEIKYQTEDPTTMNMGVQNLLQKYPSGMVFLDCLDNFVERPTLRIISLTALP